MALLLAMKLMTSGNRLNCTICLKQRHKIYVRTKLGRLKERGININLSENSNIKGQLTDGSVCLAAPLEQIFEV